MFNNAALLMLGGFTGVEALNTALTMPTLPRLTNPFKSVGLDITPPDFDDLFGHIQKVSPLARSIIQGTGKNEGFAATSNLVDDDALQAWKPVESNKDNLIHSIDRIDNFNEKNAPLLRFRASMKGPCMGDFFGKFIMDLEERKKWDAQIADVSEMYPIDDLDAANIAMGFGRYGDCSRLGVGYAQTKAALGISPREQMFLYGLQDFSDGSSIIWGTEMDPTYNHLLPDGKRLTRSKSHLFSATMTPTGPNSFDLEYLLQLEVGGPIPQFLSTPVMIDTVKNLFKVVQKEFEMGEEGLVQAHKRSKSLIDNLADRMSLLMTP